MEKTVAPYGSWRSPVSAEMAASAAAMPLQTKIDRDVVYYLERRPSEGGRSVIVRSNPDGSLADMTPADFNVRTRVHEYGGGDFTVTDGTVFFVNYSDQRVYRQASNLPAEPVTPDGAGLRYADFGVDRARQRLVCVREDHSVGGEPVNSIVAIDLATGGPGEVLASGYDFYSTPRLDPQGKRLAWLSWRHPNMPWDGTELWVAEIRDDGSLKDAQLVAGGIDESIFQPEWSPAGVLHFVSDRTGWWNLYRLSDRGIEALYPADAEFGQPQWVFDMSLYGFLGDDKLLCAYLETGLARLGVLDTTRKAMELVTTNLTDILHLKTRGGRAALIGGSPRMDWTVVGLDLLSDGSVATRNVRGPAPFAVDEGYISEPEKLEYPTERGLTASAYFYRPHNAAYAAPPGDLPPLLVFVHGGPTGQTSAVLNLAKQFWTSRGFALLDVDYGGSTGYGRAYRERLRGNWGIVDVEDSVNGVRFLVERGEVDPGRLAIRGGSAGGYTTLCALAFTDVFKAGASYFGIADVEVFAKDTHKFESRYTDSLVAPYPEGKPIYEQRSPIYFTDRLSCPLVLFQGLEDPVVPPAQSEMMYEAVRQKGLPVAYVAFPGEQHGFRRARNIIRSMEAELYFYGKVFGFEPADEIEPVNIENL